jgi:Short C-terminal domain
MANFCVNCGRKLDSLDKSLYTDKLCHECAAAPDDKRKAEAAEAKNKLRAEAAEAKNKLRAEVAEAKNKRKAEEAEAKNKRKAEEAYCKECGKKLTFLTKGFTGAADICLDCFDERRREENKRRKGHCKECGKGLPIIPRLNSDQTGYLKDLCKDCEIKYPAKLTKFNAKYIGGYGAFPEPKDVKLQTYPDHLEVAELGLTIPYNQLQNVQTMTEEKLKASRLFLVGILAFAWKKLTPYLVITFADELGIEQNPVFDVDHISVVQPFLYQQMVNARTSEPATPQPVPKPTSQDDPMEKLAKLKNLVDAGLITKEEYDTKKGEILAKM